MALNSFSTGVNTSFTSELNSNFNSLKVHEVYTSTDFDATWTSFSGAQTTSYEFSSIASSSLYSADYLEIGCLLDCFVDSSASSYILKHTLKLEVKEIGGSYSTIFDAAIFDGTYYSSSNPREVVSIPYFHTLSAGEKSNGLQVKITVTVNTNGGSGHNASVTNKQVVFKLHG